MASVGTMKLHVTSQALERTVGSITYKHAYVLKTYLIDTGCFELIFSYILITFSLHKVSFRLIGSTFLTRITTSGYGEREECGLIMPRKRDHLLSLLALACTLAFTHYLHRMGK